MGDRSTYLRSYYTDMEEDVEEEVEVVVTQKTERRRHTT